MKKFLPLLLAVIALPLFQSCVGPGYVGANYGSATNYGSSVGIVSTSHSRWGYDPYRRSYYDYSLGQYYNLSRGSYYTSLPTRYNSPFYPSYYSRGSILRAPTKLPYLSTRYTRPSVAFASTGNSRWAYDPYRRSYYDNQSKRYYNTSSGSYYSSLPKRHSSPSYPSGHRSGQSVQLNSRLPYVSNRTSSQQRTRSSSSNSNSRDQRSLFPTRTNQRPTIGSSSYRSRSTGTSSQQRDRTPSRTTTRTQTTPQRTQTTPQRTQTTPQRTQTTPQRTQTRTRYNPYHGRPNQTVPQQESSRTRGSSSRSTQSENSTQSRSLPSSQSSNNQNSRSSRDSSRSSSRQIY